MKSFLMAAGAAVALAASPVSAQSFFSDFENEPGGPGPGSFTIVGAADGWTGGPSGIELQNNVAGAPSVNPDGGDVFVELDTTQNSYMFRTIAAGTYDLSFLYSPRPGVSFNSNAILVTLNGADLSQISGIGGTGTTWSLINVSRFTATGPSELRFSAEGLSEGLGGYVDNISLSAVPEPATWALMILGFGAVGGAMRRRSAAKLAIA